MNQKVKIAYIALEIPALSATFVYKEILELEKNGFEVLPISVHVPHVNADEEETKDLSQKTHYLYRESVWVFLQANMKMMFKHPFAYLKTGITAIRDALKTGILSHTGMGLIYRFFVSSRVADILCREKCRHMHIHFAHVPTDIGMYASMISGISFSFTSHANDLFERGWLLQEKVDRSRFAVTISDYNRSFLTNQGATTDKIHVLRCGVDAASFPPRNPKPKGKILKIGTLGRMVEKKGFDVLIHASKRLKQTGMAFHLFIAGDGPLREELENLVRSQEITPDVTFTGPLSHDGVPDWLGDLDLFVLPCRQDRNGDMDGIPVVLMEAMLSGVPVISTQISGIPELVENGKTGILVQPENPEELSGAIQRISADGCLRQRLCTNGVQKIRSEFDLSKNVEKLISLFKGAM